MNLDSRMVCRRNPSMGMGIHRLLHHLLLLLLIATALRAQSRPTSDRLKEHYQPCASSSSSCGHLSNISYPFRLSTDPPSCGDSDYQITCLDDRSPVLTFGSRDYLVKQISYPTQTIRLLDSTLSNATCPLPDDTSSLSLSHFTTDPRYRGHVADTYTSFFKCSKGTNLSDQAYRRVPCLAVDDEEEVYVSYGAYIISGLEGPCEFIASVPTIYQPVLYPSYGSIMALLQSGFDLGWSVECRDCVKKDGGSCVLASWDTPFVYKCRLPAGTAAGTVVGAILSVLLTGLLGMNLIARFIIAPIVIIGFLLHKRNTNKKGTSGRLDNNILSGQQSLAVRRFTYSDIVLITSQFKDRIGKGGFGTVYKGQLPDGQFVAVKILDCSKVNDEDFMREVSVIVGIRHPNVVSLFGICYEDSHRALVLEYMPNGSLDKYIFARNAIQPLSWEILFNVVLGTARGIERLHVGCDVCIIHFDIKPQNVLLDQNFVPRVSDFGLAKFCPKKADIVSVISVRGTMCYIAPELISGNLGAASCKSDVYSFGMLLLEVVRGKRNVDAGGKCLDGVYFPSWIYEHLSGGGDLNLENATVTEAAIARKMCLVGLSCIQKEPSDRPSMAEVVWMLEGNVNELQLPLNSLTFPEHSYMENPRSDSSAQLLISEAAVKHQPAH